MNESSQCGVSRLANGAIKKRLSEAVYQFTRRHPNALKAETLKNGKPLSSLKKRYLQCFGARANNVATLQGIVRDLIEDGISRRTLVAWAVEAGYTRGYVSSLLSRILVSLGLRERKKGAGRKPSPHALELLSYARSRYGENYLNVLRAAWRAGKAHCETADSPDETSASGIMMALASPFRKPEVNCGPTIRRGSRPAGQDHSGQYRSAATVANGKKRGFTLKLTGT
ncbi:MAG TPA: hypothetical protein VMF08_21230 [Candidatus Sulfotelmatobacter sp.]|nr:hypothetical protein [Candidatus Sulfotelmatobacter sp.]